MINCKILSCKSDNLLIQSTFINRTPFNILHLVLKKVRLLGNIVCNKYDNITKNIRGLCDIYITKCQICTVEWSNTRPTNYVHINNYIRRGNQGIPGFGFLFLKVIQEMHKQKYLRVVHKLG